MKLPVSRKGPLPFPTHSGHFLLCFVNVASPFVDVISQPPALKATALIKNLSGHLFLCFVGVGSLFVDVLPQPPALKAMALIKVWNA